VENDKSLEFKFQGSIGVVALSMKQIFSSPDSAQVGLAQSRLDVAGIACEIRNDALSQAMPGLPFMTELWVLHDEDYEAARALIGPE
jgi:hypothetical protein